MEIIGKVWQIAEGSKFKTSQGNTYEKKQLILQDLSNTSRYVCIDFVEKKLALLNNEKIRVGAIISVQVDVDSRCVNGVWFTNLRGWRID